MALRSSSFTLAGSSHRVTSFVKSGPFSPPELFLGLDGICPMLPSTIPRMKLTTEDQFVQAIPIQAPENHQFTIPIHQVQQRPPNEVLPITEAIQIKAAEYWLKLGEADLAMKELEALPTRIWRCSWAIKTRLAAMGALSGRDELAAQG